MSQENVEAFKRGVDADNRRDLEAMLEDFDPEVEWHSALLMSLGGEATVYRGHEGIRKLYRDLDEVLDKFHWEYAEIRDLGDRVVGIGRFRTRGKGAEPRPSRPSAPWSTSRTARRFGFGPTSTRRKPSKPPGCRSRRCRRRTSRWFGAASGALTPSGDAVEDVV